MKKHPDFPFYECVEAGLKLRRRGFTTYQKFTCRGCGARLTIDAPNCWFKHGHCDKCNTVTDLEKHGCNYAAMFNFDPSVEEAKA